MSNLHRSTRHVVSTRRVWAIAVAAVCALAPLAIAGKTEAAPVTITVNSGLSPQALTVVVGTTVTWQMTAPPVTVTMEVRPTKGNHPFPMSFFRATNCPPSIGDNFGKGKG